ncbi:unnamed protein product [Timema podura]|uniref:Uncharacterized protein n=1 Tax=Timema podura TaxID=61482 RepID=A0ABN7P6R7_TIMPD|nr:unnamed protein product [Timema podura]
MVDSTESQAPKGKQRKKLYSSPYLEPQPVIESKIWSKLDKYKRLKKLEKTSQFTLKGPCPQSVSESRETVLKIVPLDMLDILEFMAVHGNPLAALPNVHKLPQIKMWIKNKNGFQLNQNIKG